MYSGIILLPMAWFSSSHLRRIINILFIYFSGLQQEPLQKRFLRDFYFRANHLVWIQKLKLPMITIKVITENQAYWGFPG